MCCVHCRYHRAIGFTTEKSCSIPCKRRDFSFLQSIQTISGAHSIFYSVATGVKWPRHESDYSFPSSDEIENEWSYSSIPSHAFMAWRLIEHCDYCLYNVIRFYLLVSAIARIWGNNCVIVPVGRRTPHYWQHSLIN